jgi:UDP-N-acetyl-2-amino-2-deoxyglucuronate dehydrogenase
MKKIRCAIIGCGVIAPTHIWAIEENEKAELIALCDIDENRMMNIAQNRDLLFFKEWDKLLSSPEIDAVALCLPHHLHAQAFIDAIKAGKHVICEKPLGIGVKELLLMKEAARKGRKNGLKAGGIFQHRFSPLIEETSRVLEENRLGELEKVSLNFLCYRDQKYYDSATWRGRWDKEGGGLLINQAIHTIDLLIQLIGMPDRVEGKLFREKLLNIDVEDRAEAHFFYGKNRKISLKMENDCKTNWQAEICLTGSKSNLTLEGSEGFRTSDISLNHRLTPFTKEGSNKGPGKACYGSLHRLNYADFLEAIEEDREPKVSLKSLSDTTEVVLALYQSHFTQSPITLPLSKWENPTKLQYQGIEHPEPGYIKENII